MELVRLFTLMVMFTKEVTRMGKDVDKDCVSLARLVLFTKESGKRTNHLVTVGFFHCLMKLLRLDLMVIESLTVRLRSFSLTVNSSKEFSRVTRGMQQVLTIT